MFTFFLLSAWASPNQSLGSNPVVVAAGSSSTTLFTAPSDQIILISDIILSATGHNGGLTSCISHIQILLSSGTVIGDFRLMADGNDQHAVGSQHSPSNISHSFRAGLPIPASQSASISISGNCSVSYTIAGYHAQP